MSFACRYNRGYGVATAPPAMTYSTLRPGQAVNATVTFNTDGTVVGTPGLGAPGVDTTHSWFTPVQAGVGSGFFIRITPTVGALTTNGASVFTALSAPVAITRNTSGGTATSCTYTVDISTDAGGVNIISTQTGNVITADGT